MSTCRALRHTLCSIRIQRVYATCIIIACACSISYANRHGYMQREFDGAAWNDIALGDPHISDPIGTPGRSVVLHHTKDAGAVLLSMILIGDFTLLLCLLSRAYRSRVAVMRTLYSAVVIVVAASALVLPPPHNGTFKLTIFATTATIIDLHSTFRTVAVWEAMTPHEHTWRKVIAAIGYTMSQTSSCAAMHTYAGCIVLGAIMAAFICTAIHPAPVDPVELARRDPPAVLPYGNGMGLSVYVEPSIEEYREAVRERNREIWATEERATVQILQPIDEILQPIDDFFEDLKQMSSGMSRTLAYAQLSTAIPPDMPAHELAVSHTFNKAIRDISRQSNGAVGVQRDLSVSIEDDEMP